MRRQPQLVPVLLLLLLLLWRGDAYATAAESPVLLIVGDVTSTTARVLYDRVAAPPSPSPPLSDEGSSTVALARVFALAPLSHHAPLPVYIVEQEISIDLTTKLLDRPNVLQLHGLRAATPYRVAFQFPGHTQREETVRFRTAPEHSTSNTCGSTTCESTTTPTGSTGTTTRVLVVSCDRLVGDHDDATWIAIQQDIQQHNQSYFGMAHIGDQVYVDASQATSIAIEPVEPSLPPVALRAQYESVVHQFRQVYRATFGRHAAQQVLRHGAHWMVPDDHEVLNNVNSYSVQRIFQKQQDHGTDEDDGATRALALGQQLHYRAGIQTLCEYQYQLRNDLPSAVDFLLDPLDQILTTFPLYFPVEIGNLKLFFLDVRFDRSFSILKPQAAEEEPLAQLVSERQFQSLASQLAEWEHHQANSVVVLASMPLFFHSQFTAQIVFMVEKELYPGHREHFQGLKRLFQLFLQSPQLQLVVGGDIHALVHSKVCDLHTKTKCFDQLITSGLTNGSTAIRDWKLVPFYYLITALVPWWQKVQAALALVVVPRGLLLDDVPWRIHTDRVFLGRNFGVLEVAGDGGGFEWKNSVVLAHETVRDRVVQWLFDAKISSVVLTLIGAVLLRRVALMVLLHQT